MGTPGSDCFSNTYSLARIRSKVYKRSFRIFHYVSSDRSTKQGGQERRKAGINGKEGGRVRKELVREEWVGN